MKLGRVERCGSRKPENFKERGTQQNKKVGREEGFKWNCANKGRGEMCGQ